MPQALDQINYGNDQNGFGAIRNALVDSQLLDNLNNERRNSLARQQSGAAWSAGDKAGAVNALASGGLHDEAQALQKFNDQQDALANSKKALGAWADGNPNAALSSMAQTGNWDAFGALLKAKADQQKQALEQANINHRKLYDLTDNITVENDPDQTAKNFWQSIAIAKLLHMDTSAEDEIARSQGIPAALKAIRSQLGDAQSDMALHEKNLKEQQADTAAFAKGLALFKDKPIDDEGRRNFVNMWLQKGTIPGLDHALDKDGNLIPGADKVWIGKDPDTAKTLINAENIKGKDELLRKSQDEAESNEAWNAANPDKTPKETNWVNLYKQYNLAKNTGKGGATAAKVEAEKQQTETVINDFLRRYPDSAREDVEALATGVAQNGGHLVKDSDGNITAVYPKGTKGDVNVSRAENAAGNLGERIQHNRATEGVAKDALELKRQHEATWSSIANNKASLDSRRLDIMEKNSDIMKRRAQIYADAQKAKIDMGTPQMRNAASYKAAMEESNPGLEVPLDMAQHWAADPHHLDIKVETGDDGKPQAKLVHTASGGMFGRDLAVQAENIQWNKDHPNDPQRPEDLLSIIDHIGKRDIAEGNLSARQEQVGINQEIADARKKRDEAYAYANSPAGRYALTASSEAAKTDNGVLARNNMGSVLKEHAETLKSFAKDPEWNKAQMFLHGTDGQRFWAGELVDLGKVPALAIKMRQTVNSLSHEYSNFVGQGHKGAQSLAEIKDLGEIVHQFDVAPDAKSWIDGVNNMQKLAGAFGHVKLLGAQDNSNAGKTAEQLANEKGAAASRPQGTEPQKFRTVRPAGMTDDQLKALGDQSVASGRKTRADVDKQLSIWGVK